MQPYALGRGRIPNFGVQRPPCPPLRVIPGTNLAMTKTAPPWSSAKEPKGGAVCVDCRALVRPNPCEGTRPDVVSGCCQRQGQRTPPIATGSMPPRLHPGRTDLACCCLSEGRQWVQERIKSSILPPVLPHPTKSILGHPGASFRRIPVQVHPPAPQFPATGGHETAAWIRVRAFPVCLHPCEGIRPDVASGCRQR